jgi:hypothetical protein
MPKSTGYAPVLFALILGAGLGACSTSGESGSPPAAAPGSTPGQGVSIEVVNEQRTEAEIWALLGAERQRLGTVPSFGKDTFLIRMTQARNVRLEFRIFAGPTCVTRDVALVPGDAVTYTIPLDITRFDAVCRMEG